VTAERPHGSRVTDLPVDQLWRASTFDSYAGGRWMRKSYALSRGGFRRNITTTELPDLGPGQFYLIHRQAPNSSPACCLAYPIWFGNELPNSPGYRAGPVRTETDTGILHGWWGTPDGSVIMPDAPVPGQNVHYRQVTKRIPEPDISPPLVSFAKDRAKNYTELGNFPILRQWTNGLVKMLVEKRKLPADVFDEKNANFPTPPAYHETIARAFTDYLKFTGNFRYSLKLTRSSYGQDLDPVEDFLVYTRTGHCNRFATALTLMLRARGVPARIAL